VHSQGGDDGLKAQSLQVAGGGLENLLQESQPPAHFQRRRVQGAGERLGNKVLSGEIFEHRTLLLKALISIPKLEAKPETARASISAVVIITSR
jgi:hypothetical protein